MKINGIEIAGYESIVANLDVVNDEIRPLNHKENFSCNDRVKGGIWYQFYFDNLLVTVICHGGSYGGDYGLFEKYKTRNGTFVHSLLSDRINHSTTRPTNVTSVLFCVLTFKLQV